MAPGPREPVNGLTYRTLPVGERRGRGIPGLRGIGRGRRRAPDEAAHPIEAGTTIVGDSVLPETGADGALEPVAPHKEVVDAEGAAEATAPSALLDTATAWLFRAGQEPVAVDPRDLTALVAAPENFVWVDLSTYGEDDLRAVGRLLGLHRKAVHAALSPWQRPRLAAYPDHFFTSATIARLDPAAYRVGAGELDLFAGHNYLVSAHKQPLPFAAHLLARARSSPELVTLDAAFMLYVVLDETLAYYEELNEHMQVEIERMEERALRDASDRYLEDLTRFKRYAFALAQVAEQHRAVFAAYLRPDFPWVAGEEVEDYFEDLDARLSRLLVALSNNREAVNGSFEIYVSQMAHRTNAVIRTLTLVSTVLFSTSVVIGLFGSTVQGLVSASNTPTGFVLMLVCIVAIGVATLWAFRRRGWL